MTKLLDDLFSELQGYINSERAIDVGLFPEDTSLDKGQSVELMSSTFTDGLMVYIYKVSQINYPDEYISSSHSDGGVTVFCDGPWNSLETAEGAFGDCPEGWTLA